ncbi:MAG: MBL fold metallo-hydrolase [Clostridiales bacterium]|nr:MBL fold metallo-hydrolase [Clostridiales bacterium]
MNITRDAEYQFFNVGTKIYQCYCVTYKDKAVLIDTGAMADRATIEANLQKDFIFDIDAIFLTHSHGDSAGNAEYFSMLFNCPVYCIKTAVALVKRGLAIIPPKDHPYMKKVGNAAGLMLKLPSFIPYEGCQDVKPLTKDIVQELLGNDAQLLMTPGHTQDSISIAIRDVAFIGDCAQFKKRVLAPVFVDSESQLATTWESLLRLKSKYYLSGHGRPWNADEWLNETEDKDDEDEE